MAVFTRRQTPQKIDLPFLKKAANILLPKSLEFQPKSPPIEFRIGEGLQKSEADILTDMRQREPLRIGTTIKVPLIPKEFTVSKSFIAETTKGLVEIPDTVILSLKQAPAIIKSGGKIPPPPISRQRFDIKTYAEQTEELIGKGVDPAIAALWVGSTATLDIAIMGGGIKSGAEFIKKKIPLPDQPIQAAMQSMGLKEGFTQAERQKAYRELAHILHPDKATGSKTAFQQLNEANQILKTASTQKIPTILRPLRTAAERLTTPISELGKPLAQKPFLGVRGLLPMEAGTIPEKPFMPRRPAFGLRRLEIQEFPAKKIPASIEKIKPAEAGFAKLPVKPISQMTMEEAKTAKIPFDEWVKGQPTYYH